MEDNFTSQMPEDPGHDQDEVPGQLVVKTAGEGAEENMDRVSRKRKAGRPKGGGVKKPSSVSSSNIVEQPRIPRTSSSQSLPTSPPQSTSQEVEKSTPSQSNATGTKTRPKVFLLDNAPSSFGFSKLPKTNAVLGIFLTKLKENQNNEFTAAQNTTKELLEVWKHHFGERVIMGYDSNLKEESVKMVSDDKNIQKKIITVWKDWHQLEKESRRGDRRGSTPGFLKKQDRFVNEVLDMPFKILGRGYEDVLKSSGIKDWKEDLQHLHNQMERDQIGTCLSEDFKQRKKDNREAKEKMGLKANKTVPVTVDVDAIEEVDDHDEEADLNDRMDKDFVFRGKKKINKKVDIMGPITPTADRLGLSVRQRCVIAASVANTLGVDINNTNISKSSAHERTKQERLKIASSVKEEYQLQKPKIMVGHWDGKIFRVKGNKVSNRVCVYVTGVDAENTRKLLGVPETVDGTGKAESDVVTHLLEEWGIKAEIVGMVFDTTSSNTGADNGACKFLEDWVESPVLWLGCRHHVKELHLKRVVQDITGQTTDPGVKMFRRLKSEWHSLEIDYANLSKFDFTSVPDWMQEEGMAVLDWAKKELAKKTWPRADYGELIKLTIICLGGEVEGFKFMLPGPDHHARFMSKCLYLLKIKLLFNSFKVSEEEKAQVDEICTFILIFYVKAWFQSPLPTAAARNDLSFMYNMMRYRQVAAKPTTIMAVMQSCYRHLWYLVPQTVVFALADADLPDRQKEAMARKLHSFERTKIDGGKPVFPFVDLSGGEIPCMSSFVTSDSWLVFDFLGLTEVQDWLTIPAVHWENFSQFKKVKEFAQNISVCNDIAERGIALISSYINKAESEEQRQALLQVVEQHRELVKNTNKDSLKLC